MLLFFSLSLSLFLLRTILRILFISSDRGTNSTVENSFCFFSLLEKESSEKSRRHGVAVICRRQEAVVETCVFT